MNGIKRFATGCLIILLLLGLLPVRTASASETRYVVYVCFGAESTAKNSLGIEKSFTKGDSDIGWYLYRRDGNTKDLKGNEIFYADYDEDSALIPSTVSYHSLELTDFTVQVLSNGSLVNVDGEESDGRLVLYLTESQLGKNLNLQITRTKTGTSYLEVLPIPASSEWSEHSGQSASFQCTGATTATLFWSERTTLDMASFSSPLTIITSGFATAAKGLGGLVSDPSDRQLLHQIFNLLRLLIVFVNVAILMWSLMRWTNPNRHGYVLYFIKEEIKGRFFLIFVALASVFIVSTILDVLVQMADKLQ